LEAILHGAGLGRDAPGVIPSQIDGVHSLRNRDSPLRAIRRKLRVYDMTGRGEARSERFASGELPGLRTMHGFVGLELRSNQCVLYVGPHTGDGPAGVAMREAREVIGHGGALSEG
jgi:hypothetical protein